MTTSSAAGSVRPPARTYLNAESTVASWLLTRDHKRVALLYLATLTLFFLLGLAAAVLMRLELLTPAADVMSADTYNKVFSFHGVVMVYFFVIPSLTAAFGNFLLPMMIGARTVAFPRLNLASWYLFAGGGFLVLAGTLAGGVDAGWTFMPPLSASLGTVPLVLVLGGVVLAGLSYVLTAVDLLVTVALLRADGMTWSRLPVFVWFQVAASLVMALASPVLVFAFVLLAAERLTGMALFDPAQGGDPVLYRHLFWFFATPAVYLVILPALGAVTEILACFSGRGPAAYRLTVGSAVALALFSFLVWGQHLMTGSSSPLAGLVFSFLSFLIAVPFFLILMAWIATLFRGALVLATPMLYALYVVGLLAIGGTTGLALASLATGRHLHHTAFVVAHFHYLVVGVALFGFLGALHYWWPKTTGKTYSEAWARPVSVVLFLGMNMTFLPQFLLGQLGLLRRQSAYPEAFQLGQVLSSAGASILVVGLLLTMLYLAWSLRGGAPAPANPWSARGLEWCTASPPSPANFAFPPTVTGPAYSDAWLETQADPAAVQG